MSGKETPVWGSYSNASNEFGVLFSNTHKWGELGGLLRKKEPGPGHRPPQVGMSAVLPRRSGLPLSHHASIFSGTVPLLPGKLCLPFRFRGRPGAASCPVVGRRTPRREAAQSSSRSLGPRRWDHSGSWQPEQSQRILPCSHWVLPSMQKTAGWLII